MGGSSHLDVQLAGSSSVHTTRAHISASSGRNDQDVSESDRNPVSPKRTTNPLPALATQSAVASTGPSSLHGSFGRHLPDMATHLDHVTSKSQSPLSSRGTESTQTQPPSKNHLQDGQLGASNIRLRSGQGSSIVAKSGAQSPSRLASGRKRTATGDIKSSDASAAPPGSSVNGRERQHFTSIGSSSRGSRIAALSVHLRTRLSYAAAQIEKSRQSLEAQVKLPLNLLEDSSAISSLIGSGPTYPDGTDSAVLEQDSPNGSTVSAPDLPIKPHLCPPDSSARLSPATRSEDLSTAPQSVSQSSPKEPSAFPRLAPPADIVSSGSSSRRRRPNPNAPLHYTSSFDHGQYPQHRSGPSELTDVSQKVLVPGTPPLPPSSHATPTLYSSLSRQSTHSQSASKEQDAIETLLFMSSPGNSAYHPSSQRQQSASRISNTSISVRSSTTQSQTQDSQADGEGSRLTAELPDRSRCLEAQAGDEIDRMLDQMEDSDSEEETKPALHLSHAI